MSDNPKQELADLHGRIDGLANLAAEHMNCSGCPTPWWLTNWLAAEVSERAVDANSEDDDRAEPEEGAR